MHTYPVNDADRPWGGIDINPCRRRAYNAAVQYGWAQRDAEDAMPTTNPEGN